MSKRILLDGALSQSASKEDKLLCTDIVAHSYLGQEVELLEDFSGISSVAVADDGQLLIVVQQNDEGGFLSAWNGADMGTNSCG